jgi:hypothetical protein
MTLQVGLGSWTIPPAAPAIPDSGNLQAHYKFDEYDAGQTNNFKDFSENSYKLDNGSITGTDGINSIQAGDFDSSSNDTVYMSNDFGSDITPVTIYAVVDLEGSEDGTEHNVVNTNDGNFTRFGWNGSNWELYQGNNIIGSNDATTSLITAVIDVADSKLREEGTTVATGDIGTRNVNFVGLGSAEPERSERYFDGQIGEVIFYNVRHSASTINEVESYLADKWSITI